MNADPVQSLTESSRFNQIRAFSFDILLNSYQTHLSNPKTCSQFVVESWLIIYDLRESSKKLVSKATAKWNIKNWNFIRKSERFDEGQVSSIVKCLYKHRQTGALVTLGRSPVIFYQLILTLFWKPSETPSMTKRDIDLKKSFKTVKWITPLDEDECTIRWCWWKREKCEQAGDTLKCGSHCFVLKRTLSPGRNQENAFPRGSSDSASHQ